MKPEILKKLIKFVVIIALIVSASLLLWYETDIRYVQIEGLTKYSNEEFLKLTGWDGVYQNTFLYTWKSINKKTEDIPFIDDYEVKIVDRHTLWINVYENEPVGYVKIMGDCFLFDKNGFVLATTIVEPANLPEITGFDFNEIIVLKKLEISKQSLFDTVLTVVKLLKKYDISVERIHFDTTHEVILYSENLKMLLGKRSEYDTVISALSGVYDTAKERGGTLDLRNYNDQNTSIILK